MPAMDPENALRRAVEAGLVVRTADPLNAETPISELIASVVTPTARFFVRNHFPMPVLDADTWRLEVGGLVERPLRLGLRELRRMPTMTIAATLECAGNGRALLEPAVPGERWGLGAVSTAEWTGVPLAEILDRAGPRAGAREVLFRGADQGTVEGHAEPIRFERSLSLGEARRPDVVLAYAMNGEPLPVQHGFPVRLVVPGWYAVASVKWLTEIEVIERAFAGHYQGEKYVYETEQHGVLVREPVTLQRVRALLVEPRPDEQVARGELTVRGAAWSGEAPIARVEVSVGEGRWQDARLLDAPDHGWRWWELSSSVDAPGVTTVRARATDRLGHHQPEHPAWNRLGYGNDAIQAVRVNIV